MATTIYQSIKLAMVSLFKGKYPAYDVFCEEIAKTQNDEPEPDLEDYIFLDIIPAGSATVDAEHTDRRVLVDASIHTRSESNADYLTISQEVDDLIRPVFRFEDGGEARAITVQDLTFKVVDRVLHCTFTLAFRDSVELPPQPPVMEELETTINTSKEA